MWSIIELTELEYGERGRNVRTRIAIDLRNITCFYNDVLQNQVECAIIYVGLHCVVVEETIDYLLGFIDRNRENGEWVEFRKRNDWRFFARKKDIFKISDYYGKTRLIVGQTIVDIDETFACAKKKLEN